MPIFLNNDATLYVHLTTKLYSLTEIYVNVCYALYGHFIIFRTQPTFTCSKLTIETLEQGLK